MDEAPATQYSLIAKLRDPADAQAWQEFLAIYEPLVYRLARAKGLQERMRRTFARMCSGPLPGPWIGGNRTSPAAPSAAGCSPSPATSRSTSSPAATATPAAPAIRTC